MPHPTQRHTKSRKRKRRAAIKQKRVNLSICPKCKRPVRPHTACSFCGTYKKRDVIKIKIKKGSKRAKEEKSARKEKKK